MERDYFYRQDVLFKMDGATVNSKNVFAHPWNTFMTSLARHVILDADSRLATKVPPQSKILDIGTGSGIVGKTFAETFRSSVVGIDVKDNRRVPIPFQLYDGENIPFGNESFDFVLVFFVLHHLSYERRVALLRQAVRIARIAVFVAEDTPSHVLHKIFCWLHLVTYEHTLYLDKTRIKTKQEWEKEFREIGFTIKESTWLNCFNPRQVTDREFFVLRKAL